MDGRADRGREGAEDLHAPIERITVIAPMRDELPNLVGFVDDLAGQDFAGPIQILVADGGSTDGSVERLRALGAASSLDLTVLDNPAGWVSHGLNLCIERADGDLVVRLDCHSRYHSDYLRRLAELATTTGGWNVGGRTVARGVTPMERAVATAMVSPFGGIDWTRMTGETPVEVDTVKFGAFRPIAFRKAGNFDEQMVRNQDDEFNLRIEEAGGKIFLDPTIAIDYLPRGSLRAVWSQYSQYGFWKVAVMTKHRRVLTLRSMAPLVFVGSLALLALLAPFSRTARAVLAGELAAYIGGALLFGTRETLARGESPALLPRVLAVFPAFHLAYGTGMARGWLNWPGTARRARFRSRA
jgi:glycosyltransferase involved in cell wall biosynthesis